MSTATTPGREGGRKPPEWHERRSQGIGGSEAAAALGLSPYRSRFELWRAKTGHGTPTEPTPAMLRGQHLEDVAAELYEEETGRKLRRISAQRHAEHEWMLGNPDRTILATGDVEETGVLEIKCPGLNAFGRMKAHGLPDHYVLQLQHYLAVTGRSWGAFAVLNAEQWSLLHFDLERDEQLIRQLIRRERAFWRLVEDGREPPADPEEPELEVSSPGGEVEVVQGEEWQEAARELLEARELKSTAQELEGRAKDRLKDLMREAGTEAVEVPGRARLYWREQSGRTSWKKTARRMVEEHDLELEDYRVTGDPYRRFDPHPLEED